jgi:hypothetical protein
MIALAIVSLGIGFILGLAFADRVFVRPLRIGLEVIILYGKNNPGYNARRLADNILNNRPLFQGIKVYENMKPYKEIVKKPLGHTVSWWNNPKDM